MDLVSAVQWCDNSTLVKQAALSLLANCQVCRSEKNKTKNKEKQLLRYSYSVNDDAVFFQLKK